VLIASSTPIQRNDKVFAAGLMCCVL